MICTSSFSFGFSFGFGTLLSLYFFYSSSMWFARLFNPSQLKWDSLREKKKSAVSYDIITTLIKERWISLFSAVKCFSLTCFSKLHSLGIKEPTGRVKNKQISCWIQKAVRKNCTWFLSIWLYCDIHTQQHIKLKQWILILNALNFIKSNKIQCKMQ